MIKVNIQPKSVQLVGRTVITLLASAFDFVDGITFTSKPEPNQSATVSCSEYRDSHGKSLG